MPNKEIRIRMSGKDRVIPEPSRKDQLEYMADLLLELKEMARDHRLATLTGILELAHAEARLRSKDAA